MGKGGGWYELTVIEEDFVLVGVRNNVCDGCQRERGGEHHGDPHREKCVQLRCLVRGISSGQSLQIIHIAGGAGATHSIMSLSVLYLSSTLVSHFGPSSLLPSSVSFSPESTLQPPSSRFQHMARAYSTTWLLSIRMMSPVCLAVFSTSDFSNAFCASFV